MCVSGNLPYTETVENCNHWRCLSVFPLSPALRYLKYINWKPVSDGDRLLSLRFPIRQRQKPARSGRMDGARVSHTTHNQNYSYNSCFTLTGKPDVSTVVLLPSNKNCGSTTHLKFSVVMVTNYFLSHYKLVCKQVLESKESQMSAQWCHLDSEISWRKTCTNFMDSPCHQ